jgi:hypothetical protein
MNFEMPEQVNSEETEKKRLPIGRLAEGEKPDAFGRTMDLFTKATFSEIKVVGEENLDSIPAGREVIFVTTHITNSDEPLALAVLGKKFHLAAGDASTHHNISENTGAYFAIHAAGEQNFKAIKHRDDPDRGEVGVFDPENLDQMQTVFEENKALVMPAYYKDRNKDLELPTKGGYGAAYVAGRSKNVVFVPVAIDIESKEPITSAASAIRTTLSRPKARVIIGKPFEPEPMKHISAIRDITTKRHQRLEGEKLSPEDVASFKEASGELRGQSDILMQHLAELLPEEKKGNWAETTKEE